MESFNYFQKNPKKWKFLGPNIGNNDNVFCWKIIIKEKNIHTQTKNDVLSISRMEHFQHIYSTYFYKILNQMVVCNFKGQSWFGL
jgi:hypothetical protein